MNVNATFIKNNKKKKSAITMEIQICSYAEHLTDYIRIKGHFRDITSNSGFPFFSSCPSADWGDVDNSGTLDLIVNWGDIYLNTGNCQVCSRQQQKKKRKKKSEHFYKRRTNNQKGKQNCNKTQNFF